MKTAERLQTAQETIESVTRMTSHPVAVKFCPDVISIDGFEAAPDRRYCQALMEARYGAKRLLSAENVSCPAAAAAFGFKPLPKKLASGEMLVGCGIFESKEAGQATVDSMPRLEQGRWAMMTLCPLADAPFEPDFIVAESQPEHLIEMQRLMIDEDEQGALNFLTSVEQIRFAVLRGD